MGRRILLLITDLEIGGTPTVVRELAIRLRGEPGVQVEVACLSKSGPVAGQLRDAGVEVTALGAQSVVSLIGVTASLVRLIRAHQIDTVFSFLVHANTVAAIASLFCRSVRFIQSIQTTQPDPRWHWRVQSLVAPAADLIVVPSASAGEFAKRWASVPRASIRVIPNAIDADAFERSPVPAQSPTPYPIGFIGRLDPVKRVPAILSQMEFLQRMCPTPVHLHIFGDGQQRPHIEAEIQRLGLQDRVTMHGRIDRPQDALKQIGLLVLPSLAEGFGLVLIEAMAAGVPVVATDVPGIRDVIRHEQTGLLVHASAGIELGAAIARIIQDHDLRVRLIGNGLSEARYRFSWTGVLPAYRDLLGLFGREAGNKKSLSRAFANCKFPYQIR